MELPHFLMLVFPVFLFFIYYQRLPSSLFFPLSSFFLVPLLILSIFFINVPIYMFILPHKS